MPVTLAALLLATAAADSTRWVVTNHGRPAGELVATTRGDSLIVRFVFRDRNRGTRIETRYRRSPAGALMSGESRPILGAGDVGSPTESFQVQGDSVIAGDTRRALAPGAWVGLRSSTPWETAAMARHLLARPTRTAPLVPVGEVRATVIADTTLRVAGRPLRARLVMMDRRDGNPPVGVWLDARGELLATEVQWFIAAREEARPLLPALRRVELRWREREAARVSALARTRTGRVVAFTNARLFDSDAGVAREGQTLVVDGDRISALGPSASTAVPSEATVVDARGKTIIPGMWDMHGHLQVSNQTHGSLLQLMQGITTVRDLAADEDVATSQRDRERAGSLASPRIILGGFLEGPLAWAGPTEALTATEAGARAWVAHYDSLGYKQVKLYNLVHPDLVPTIAAEAKKRGMKLSGHIPRGMSVRAAVSLGFDEVQHAAFLLSDFFPDSLYLPTMRAYSAVATAVAPTFDVDSPGMKSLIAFLAERKTVIDGTFNLWIGGGAAIVGAGGSNNQSRADSTYLKLITRLYEAGVPLVAGTDNANGVTYRRELEMYVRAGIPLARVLQIATIDAARFMGEERDYGSLQVGKVADLVVIDGDPLARFADLARVETVVRGGRVYEMKDLRRALQGRVDP
ncbi:MAG: amidohydrolase family protein [Gemmatimonadetes bacterium]|nr:amidohydrolase family protein [Gemmatimonadota bacterium]